MSGANEAANGDRWASPVGNVGTFLNGPVLGSGNVTGRNGIQTPLQGGGPIQVGPGRLPGRSESVPPVGMNNGIGMGQQTHMAWPAAAVAQQQQQQQRAYASHFLPHATHASHASHHAGATKQQFGYQQPFSPLASGYLPSPIPQGGGSEKPVDGNQGRGFGIHLQQPVPQHVLTTQQMPFHPQVYSISPQPVNDNKRRRTDDVGSEAPERKATQEGTLKMLAAKHKARPLSEYAAVVRQAEVSVLNMDPSMHTKTDIQAAEQNRERERQVYALIWLMNTCVPEKDSFVPRGRIFAQYAANCAHNNLKPLSQASLGKLIRTLFPDLTTRRLGMRGQSKYHYCGLNLLSASKASTPTPSETPDVLKSDNAFASIANQTLPPVHSNTPVSLLKWTDIFEKDELRLAAKAEPFPGPDMSINIPAIQPFLPPHTDLDIASSLESLYRVHCNTILESINFKKFELLPSTLESFSSASISPQMYNLFISESLYEWIYEADAVTYKAIAAILTKFVFDFKNISPAVLTKLQELSKTYPKMVSDANMDLPVPVVLKKVQLAERFANLAARVTRLIRAAEAVSLIFADPSKTYQMNHEWKKIVDLPSLCRTEIKCCAENDESLTQISEFISSQIDELFSETVFSENSQPFIKFGGNVVEHLSSYKEIPTRLLLMIVGSFGSSIVRELAIAGSESVASWLSFKTFLDEWLIWHAELGQMLES
ncbi:LAMI_0A05622g1_1 [Lachancea mirantina]|uniref:LAMI_0A05622g1_1 n=1 Tax=Lachancea mirantina TaxID=1230905 RepID=A0A1G4IPT6_9SACH|nr:LAMI_0A05622g1_1 [Lachancea mirantina]